MAGAMSDVAARCGQLRRLCAEPSAPLVELAIAKELRGLFDAKPITVAILKQTGAAKVVKPLRKHQSGVVSELSTALFRKWKHLVQAEVQAQTQAQAQARQIGPATIAATTAADSSRMPVSAESRSLSGSRYDKRPRALQLVRTCSGEERERARAARAEEARHLLQTRQAEAELQAVNSEIRKELGAEPAPRLHFPEELSGEPPGTILSEAPFRFWSNAVEGGEDSDCRLSNLRAAWAGRFHLKIGPYWLIFTYVTPVLVTRYRGRKRPGRTVELHGRIFPSAEHAYQALKFPAAVRDRFAVGGDLASFSAFRWFFPAHEVGKKIDYWKRKEMVGVVAKMASNEKHAKAAGLPAPSFALGCTPEAFFEIELSKYTCTTSAT
jgi:hypothetical protein